VEWALHTPVPGNDQAAPDLGLVSDTNAERLPTCIHRLI